MSIKIRDLNINYIQYGSGKDIVLLHGWGQNIAMMQPLAKEFPNYRITIIDFPGFGQSDDLKVAWSIEDYEECVAEFLEKVNVKKPILIGHSFGGRVAIIYASRHEVEKLVLFGSPCVREQKTTQKEKLLKTIKKLPGMKKIGEFAKNYIGSEDYKKASPILRESFVKIVNQDLSEYAKNITCPTLLIWGTNDEAAPIEDARKLEKLLKDGALIELEGYTHYAYLEALPRVVSILNEFFKEVKS